MHYYRKAVKLLEPLQSSAVIPVISIDFTFHASLITKTANTMARPKKFLSDTFPMTGSTKYLRDCPQSGIFPPSLIS